MLSPDPRLRRPAVAFALERGLVPVDRLFNRLYTSRFSPVYQSGTLAIVCLLVLIATGLYTLIFYRIGAPYESVQALEEQWWGGRWIRALHTYAADAMLIFAGVHMLRMAIQGRTWGPRALAWISGAFLLASLFFSGWTGMVLVWDRQGQLLATEGARILDILPVFSEPIQRGFVSGTGVAAPFFFLNLLIHIVVPLWLAAIVWLHTLRVTKPAIFPPRQLAVWLVAALALLAVVWPVGHMPKASFSVMQGVVPLDLFFNFWVIPGRHLPPQATLGAWVAAFAGLASMPWWWRPRRRGELAPAAGDENLCTGCGQCYLDCPFGAIAMVPAPATNTATLLVARVNPALCVSCGICAGACAPMVIGPPGRAGRDLLLEAQAFWERARPGTADVAVLACAQGLGVLRAPGPAAGVHWLGLHCAAASHTSAIEYLIRRGTGGVYVLACPERDCAFRFGPRWIRERLFNDREAELRERVDKSRVRVGSFGKADAVQAVAEIRSFRAEIAARAAERSAEEHVEVEGECEPLEAIRV